MENKQSKIRKFQPHMFVAWVSKERNLRKKHGEFYCWNGHYFEPVKWDAICAEAYRWLVENDPLNASSNNAIACCNSLMLFIQELANQESSVIALQNKYLQVVGHDLREVAPSPEYSVTEVFRVAIEQTAPSIGNQSKFAKFLEVVLPVKPVRDRVQEYVGSSLLPARNLPNVQFWVGDGANGKSVLGNIIRAIHPRVTALKLNSLDKFGLAEALDSTLLYCDELPQTGLDEHILKALISGELIRVDRKHMSAISGSIQARMIVLGNSVPKIKDESSGIWRRLEIVPFDTHISAKDRDSSLAQRIVETESELVLHWMLEGLKRVLSRGFSLSPKIPAEMASAGSFLRAQSDSLTRWLLETEPKVVLSVSIPKDHIYGGYRSWCFEHGLLALHPAQFWKRMQTQYPTLNAMSRKRIEGKQVPICNLQIKF